MVKEVEIPTPPSLLPEGLQKKWTADYAAAYAEAQQDDSLDEAGKKQHALREANRVLRVPAPASYAEAKRFAAWQVIRQEEAGGKLKGVTIDGKKFSFEVPAPALRSGNPGPFPQGTSGAGGPGPPPVEKKAEGKKG